MMFLFRTCTVSLFILFAVLTASAQQEQEREGGILGTGIVGTITALGSIYVNGQHIKFNEDLPLEGGVDHTSAMDLKPGHTVAVVVEREGVDWRARYMRQVLPLVGPVTFVEGNNLVVLGTRIEAASSNPAIKLGQWIAVSGLWRGDTVIASRLDRLAPDQQTAQLSGTFLERNAKGEIRIGGSALRGLRTRHLVAGNTVQAFGNPDADGITASRLETGLFRGRVGIVMVQGYFSDPQPDGLYTVLGSGMIAYTDQPAMIDSKQQVARCGIEGRLEDLSEISVLSTEDVQETARHLGCQ